MYTEEEGALFSYTAWQLATGDGENLTAAIGRFWVDVWFGF